VCSKVAVQWVAFLSRIWKYEVEILVAYMCIYIYIYIQYGHLSFLNKYC
jgi:hypothetical protein